MLFFSRISIALLSKILYLLFIKISSNCFHGFFPPKTFKPCEDKLLNKEIWYPDNIITFGSKDNTGNPFVDLKFQNIKCKKSA